MPILEIIFNILIALALLAYWVAAFITLYHLARFGVGVQPKRFAGAFLFGSVVISAIVLTLAITLDLNSILALIPR